MQQWTWTRVTGVHGEAALPKVPRSNRDSCMRSVPKANRRQSCASSWKGLTYLCWRSYYSKALFTYALWIIPATKLALSFVYCFPAQSKCIYSPGISSILCAITVKSRSWTIPILLVQTTISHIASITITSCLATPAPIVAMWYKRR